MGIRLGMGLGIGWEWQQKGRRSQGNVGRLRLNGQLLDRIALVIGRFKVVGNQRIRIFGHWSHFQVHEFLFPPFAAIRLDPAARAVENTATIESHAGTRQTYRRRPRELGHVLAWELAR
jgi:hypothetical protein